MTGQYLERAGDERCLSSRPFAYASFGEVDVISVLELEREEILLALRN